LAELLNLWPRYGVAAVFGCAGAFMYGGQRWLACVAGGAGPFWRVHWRCSMEGLVTLAVGALAAAAFADWAMTLARPLGGDLPAVAAMIGLLANPIAPKLAARLSSEAAAAMAARLARVLRDPAPKAPPEDPLP
jgi:hypothetical protein